MMSSLSLAGSSSVVATEFLKSEITGLSNLATEQFVLDNAGEGGGGGDTYTTTQIDTFLASKANNADVYTRTVLYTKTETDNLLNNKVDLTGETSQTISGSVDITGGLGVIGNISCNNANCGNVYSNTYYNKDSNINVNFAHEGVAYLTYDHSTETLQVKKDMSISTKLDIPLSAQIDFENGKIKQITSIVDLLQYIMSSDTGSHRFYVGDENTASNLIMNIEQSSMNFYKDAYFSTKIFCNDFQSFGDNNVVFYQNEEAFTTFDKATDTIIFNKPTNIVAGGGYSDSEIDNLLNSKIGSQDASNQNDQTIHGQLLIRKDHGAQMTLLDYAGNNNQTQFKYGYKIDTLNIPANAGERGMYLNYDSNHYVRVGNADGFLGVNCSRDGTDSFKVVGSSLFDGQVRLTASGLIIGGGEDQCHLTEATEATYNVMRIWNKETTLNPVLRLGVGATDNVVDLTNGEIHCNKPLIVRNAGTGRYLKGLNGTDLDAYDSGNSAVDLKIQYNSGGAVILGNPTNTPCVAINKSAVVDKSFAVKGDSEFDGHVSITNSYTMTVARTITQIIDNTFAGASYFRHNGSEYMRYDHGSDSVVFEKPIDVSEIDTFADTDPLFKRNGDEYFRLDNSPNADSVPIVLVANGHGLSTPNLYGNDIAVRSAGQDMIFRGGNTAGDDRVEIFRHNRTGESLDFNIAIDNTGLPVIGIIVDAAVSDKILKKNINDIIANASNTIKNVNTKTYEYIDKKYGEGVQFGFVANDLLEELPDVFSKIVGKVKK